MTIARPLNSRRVMRLAHPRPVRGSIHVRKPKGATK